MHACIVNVTPFNAFKVNTLLLLLLTLKSFSVITKDTKYVII